MQPPTLPSPALVSLGAIPGPVLTMALWVVFGIVVFIGAIMTLILLYHWLRYGRTMVMIGTGGLIYLLGAGILLMSAIASLLTYTASIS